MTSEKYFNKFILILILIISSSNFAFTQTLLVKGFVYDTSKTPLIAVSIVESGTKNGTISNVEGEFSLILKSVKNPVIDVSYIGYAPQTIEIQIGDDKTLLPNDTLVHNIDIVLEEDIVVLGPHPHIGPFPIFWRFNRVNAVELSTTVSHINSNFQTFSEIPVEYIDVFNQIQYAVNIGIGGYYRSIYGSFNFGGSIYPYPVTEDSIKKFTHLTTYGVKFGYAFPTKRYRVVITPFFGIDILNYRLKTSDPNETIPITQYLNNQYYHITFRQWSSTVGTNIDVKIVGKQDQYLTQAIYLRVGAGYIFKLSRHPNIESPTNTLSSDGKIEMNNLYLNAGLVFYIQNPY